MKYLTSPLGPVVWFFLLLFTALLWLYPLLGWFLDFTFQHQTAARPMLIGGIILVVAVSVALGSVLRWVAAETSRPAVLVGAVIGGPMLGGWIGVASPDLRSALGLQLNGLASYYLLYLGIWIATLAYLMKIPWDRLTELGRDRLSKTNKDQADALAPRTGSVATFPAEAFVLIGIAGLAVFCLLLGAGVSVDDVGRWLTKQPDNLVTLIGSALVCAGLIFTARQWRSDARAKQDEARSRRIEQYAERIRQFRTPETNAAIMMLLNYDRDVVLPGSLGSRRVTWEHTAQALVPGLFRPYLYEPLSIAIRDCFNDLLEGMSRLHFLLGAGLVRPEDVDHICKPLLKRLVLDPQFASQALARNLRLYILWRNARGVLDLCRRYELDIEGMRAADVAALEHEIAAGTYGECERTAWGDLDAQPAMDESPLG